MKGLQEFRTKLARRWLKWSHRKDLDKLAQYPPNLQEEVSLNQRNPLIELNVLIGDEDKLTPPHLHGIYIAHIEPNNAKASFLVFRLLLTKKNQSLYKEKKSEPSIIPIQFVKKNEGGYSSST